MNTPTPPPTSKPPSTPGAIIAGEIADLLNRINAPVFDEAAALACCAIGHAAIAGDRIDPEGAAEIAKHLRTAADGYEKRANRPQGTH